MKMEDFVSSLQEMSAVQLVDKKDSIERESKEFTDVLQTVREMGLLYNCKPCLFNQYWCSKVEWGCTVLWWIEMAFPGVMLMCMLFAQLEIELYVS